MPVIIYRVQAGETLAEVAERFGFSAEALASANHLARATELAAGQALILPDVPLDLTAGAFPPQGWIPPEAWLVAPTREDDGGEAGEPPRAVVVERMWRLALPFPNLAVSVVDHVLLTLHASPSRPQAGRVVTLRLIAVNLGPTPLILRSPTTQRAEFVVTRDGEEVFRSSAGRLYAQQLREVVLGPGQSEVAVERFVPPEPGSYRLTAWNLALRPARLSLDLDVG